MLCPHPGQENGHRPLPAPLAPSALFWVYSVQEEDPRLRGPTTLTSKSVAVFPLLTQLDPEAFLPHGVWGGSCLGRAAGAKVGSTKDGGLSGYIPADSPILEVPAAGWCGQHPSAGHCPVWPSCQRIVGLPPWSVSGRVPAGKGTWEGVELGGGGGREQHRGYFCNRYCQSKWKWDDLQLLLPKRCKFIVALGVWVGTHLGLCFCFLLV